jgi:hypothetical protein
MIEFHLDAPPPEPLTPAQRNAIYWRAWNTAEKARPGLNRFSITHRVLGRVKKITEMSDDEFRKLVRAFGHIAKKSDKTAAHQTDDADPESRGQARSLETAHPSRPRNSRSSSPDFQIGKTAPAARPEAYSPGCENMIRTGAPEAKSSRAIQEIGYPASQLAPAIGVTATRIRQCLGASGKIDNAGVRAWTLNNLPSEWRTMLAARRKAAGFASDDEWIASRKPWQPHIPFSELAEKLRYGANQRRDVIAPVLRTLGEPSTSLIVRTAIEGYRTRRLAMPGERSLRRWIETAIARDDGRCDFDRAELYLQGRLIRARDVRAQANAQCPAPSSWQEACHLCSTFISAGESESGARRKTLRLLLGSPLVNGMTADATRKALARKIDQWTADAALKDRRTESGRRAKFHLNAKECRVLRWYRLQKESLPAAIPAFSRHPGCRHETRELIQTELDAAARERRKPTWPLSLRRAGEVTLEQEAAFRSKRALREIGYGDRRGNFWRDEAGEKILLVPNSIWESDDFSSNEPFKFVDSETGASSLGRQVLATIDVYTAAFLGESPVGRSKDAYRVEDIADHMLHCVLQHGLPLIWRLERGPWENNFIDGIPLNDGSRWGGLKDIIKIARAFGPQSKGLIEVRFNQLQRVMAHESTSIGRRRGEFREATKLVNRARNGDARALARFWDISAAADGIERAMKEANRDAMQRRSFGRQTVVPEELYQSAVKRLCPENELWRFCPVKREATIRKCAVESSVQHYPMPFRFRVNGIRDNLYLPSGYRVLIAFHPGHPERGCHIFNAEEGPRNTESFRRHELIMVAPLSEDAPQVNYSRDEQRFITRRKANAQLSGEFRAITATGENRSRVSVRRDSYGNSATRAIGPAGTENERAVSLLDQRDARSRRGDAIISEARAEFDEDAELRRIKQLEQAAIKRGDILRLT